MKPIKLHLLFGEEMTKLDKFKPVDNNQVPSSNSNQKESVPSPFIQPFGRHDFILPNRVASRTYQSSDLPTILFLCKRGMSRSPLAQEIMRDLLQRSSYFGRIRVSSRGVNIVYNDCSVDGRMQSYSSKLDLILHGTSKFATVPDLANASLIITMDADSEDFVKVHKNAIRGHTRPIGIFLAPGSEPYIQDPYDRGEDTDVDDRYESIIASTQTACTKILAVIPNLVL